MERLEKLFPKGKKGEVSKGYQNGDLAKRYPFLWELLTVKVYRDGSMRMPAAVAITVGRFGIVATLNERQERCSTSVEVLTFDEIFDALEAKISGPNPGFREWGSPAKGGQPKKN